MRMLICGLAVSLGFVASDVTAEIKLNVDGSELDLSTLMENCRSMTGAPEAQVACFNAVSQLLEKQLGGGAQASNDDSAVTDALDALRTVAQYQDDDTGLTIVGTDCSIQILYFDNYYHLSRRNVSSIDLYSAEFDASKLQYDQTAASQGAQAPLSKGFMEDGATATMRGGPALESTSYKFAPKSARMSVGDYASEVAPQLPANDYQAFDFVLVHPKQAQASGDIWSAFESFVAACKS